eukprot:1001435-Pyramimonas_sp.AAC.1
MRRGPRREARGGGGGGSGGCAGRGRRGCGRRSRATCSGTKHPISKGNCLTLRVIYHVPVPRGVEPSTLGHSR